MQNNKLLIQNIAKYYNKKLTLSDISIELLQGEVVGLFGPNGAGKTTLFSIIIGIIKTDRGKLILGDHDITNLPIHQRARLGINYLPQESSIFRHMNVKDNIKAILEIKNYHRNKIESRTMELLEEFSISHLQDKLALTLSGGERRRLEIARSLASDPSFILLDEPFSGVDPIAVSDIKQLIGHLKKRNIGVLVTDHNVRETLAMVDRAYIIYDGKVLIKGSPEKIINDAKTQKLYLGRTFERTF